MGRRARWGVVVGLVGVVGLASVAVAGKAKPPKAIALAKSKVAPAKWPAAGPKAPPEFRLWAVDRTLGLARSAERPDVLMAWTAAGGVVGPIALPAKITWVGTGDGAIYAASEDGVLYRADDLATALARGLAKVATVKGAKEWDAGGRSVVAAVGDGAWISGERGDGGRARDFGAPVRAVFARGDGVVVVVPHDSWAHVTRDAGKTWDAPPAALDPEQQQRVGCSGRAGWGLGGGGDEAQAARGTCYYPAQPYFVRDGDRIYARARTGAMGCSSGSCDIQYSCMEGELAADGASWIALPDADEPYAGYARAGSDPFALGDRAHDEATPDVPAATPARGAAPAGEASKRCLADPEAFFEQRGGGGVGMMGGGRACQGLACLRHAEPTPDDGTHRLFADSVCPEHDQAKKYAACTRPGTRLSVGDKGRLALSRAPCAPGWLTSQQGAAVLLCPVVPDGAAARVHLGDRAGGWFAAGELPLPAGARVDVAADGTLLVAEPCPPGKPCRAFLRAPAALDAGAAAAPWREVTHAAAVAYRVAPGGRAVIVTPASRRSGAPLKVDMRGYDSDPVFGGSYYDAWTKSYGTHPLEAVVSKCLGEAVTRLGPVTGVLEVTVRLDAAGKPVGGGVAGAPDAVARDCVDQAARALPFRKPPGAVTSSRWVGFESADQRFALWVTDGAGAPTLLADDLDASAGLRDVRVDAKGKLELSFGDRVDRRGY